MKTIHYPHEMVLIAIGYLLREDSIYFNEQYMIIEYKTFYFLIASILSHWILMMKDVY